MSIASPLSTRLALFTFALLLFAFTRPSFGCTLWAATGAAAGGKGTLIAKNRDNSKELTTELRLVSRETGFPFVGLFDPEADGYVVAGVNSKGLTVVNASATSLPDDKRNVAKEDLTERVLTTFPSVDAVVREEAMFARSHPAFYMVADSGKIALIEVAPGGKTSIKVTRNGVLTHTNHYVDRALLKANERPARGSRRRLERINHLLADCPAPYSLDGFITLSQDRNGAQSGGILEPCGPGKNVCTLATWAVSLPEGGFPEIYVKILKQDYTETVERLKLDARFWGRTPLITEP